MLFDQVDWFGQTWPAGPAGSAPPVSRSDIMLLTEDARGSFFKHVLYSCSSVREREDSVGLVSLLIYNNY